MIFQRIKSIFKKKNKNLYYLLIEIKNIKLFKRFVINFIK